MGQAALGDTVHRELVATQPTVTRPNEGGPLRPDGRLVVLLLRPQPQTGNPDQLPTEGRGNRLL